MKEQNRSVELLHHNLLYHNDSLDVKIKICHPSKKSNTQHEGKERQHRREEESTQTIGRDEDNIKDQTQI